MPKLGVEPIRRAALVQAAIDEIGAVGTLDVTVARIARAAGMSSALAHHYFGSKERIFLAAMRHVLSVYGDEVRAALAEAPGPEARLDAIVRAQFSEANFRPAVIAAWLNFYVLARTNDEAARLLRVYHRRLVSNLAHALRPRAGAEARAIAERAAALIDGVYLRQSLSAAAPEGGRAAEAVRDMLAAEIARAGGAGR